MGKHVSRDALAAGFPFWTKGRDTRCLTVDGSLGNPLRRCPFGTDVLKPDRIAGVEEMAEISFVGSSTTVNRPG